MRLKLRRSHVHVVNLSGEAWRAAVFEHREHRRERAVGRVLECGHAI